MLILLFSFSRSLPAQETYTWRAVNYQISRDFPMTQSIDVGVLSARMARSPISLIDVRAPAEFRVSHIKDALNLERAEDIAKKFPDKETELVLYCSIGYRSAKLGSDLKKMGYLNVWNLKGSIFDWANKGNPVYRGAVKAMTVHPYNRFWGILLDKKYHPIRR